MSRLSPLRRTLVVTLALALSACAETSDSVQVNYSLTAKDNYDRGAEALKAEAWLDAIKYFQYTRSKYGFSKWATLAELGIADAQFGSEKYDDAVDSYRTFIKNHPTHEKVQDGYAAFQIARCYYKQIPTDWFMVPPSYEKDQGPVKDALRELSAFVDEYGDSPYLAQAKKLVAECTKRLAEHELYVAGFYLDRGKPKATVWRLEGMLKKYPGSSFEPEVLLMLGRTYMKMEQWDDAKRTFQRLIVSHPTDYHSEKAKLYLDYIARQQQLQQHAAR